MPLYVKDPQVDALADELTSLRGSTKTEAVRQALLNEIARAKESARAGGEADLVERTLAFTRRLRARAGSGQPADKTFIDSLYERD
ncbi:type II toxin-antitoxin system VapB family antitoxin [Methylobacterium sp. SD21]|uniref:type II toxin-antitoxin system VapB family antitoxin n=1 Tax=Methylobacterium litchii TaxID=3138810 RepID=UPI00313D174B